ncbi:Piso0_005282 [Millerozyma farinosa CBS 7064]|uniref:Piso0_005282 protein n=1 Tax=Pichia sorbitophila (strain ATCC MYA-4447 / BCRC 22081 / CBS 7064 / NBRC 10061 / NRRL Y-12695) TaxID=559304 RepID=G8Y4P4_PICSO|nr:Piso0_005282 [Millerozyma farinosa CBS 7064]
MHSQNINPLSRVLSQHGSKKSFMENDDDNTFLPPALSSYSIALLNEKSNNTQSKVTGIYELDFPDSMRHKNNLKSRLSVHFKDSIPRDKELSTVEEEKENRTEWEKDIAKHEHGQTSGNESQNAGSFNSNNNNNNNNTSYPNNTSAYTSFNMSSHNYSTNTHNTTSEYNDDIMDVSNHDTESKTSNNTYSANTSNTKVPSSSSSTSRPVTAQGNSAKRLRSTRRFGRALGPPQRNTKLEYNMESSVEALNEFAGTNTEEKEERNSSGSIRTPSPIHLPNFSRAKSTILDKTYKQDSALSRTLSKLQADIPSEKGNLSGKATPETNVIPGEPKLFETSSYLQSKRTLQDIENEINLLSNSGIDAVRRGPMRSSFEKKTSPYLPMDNKENEPVNDVKPGFDSFNVDAERVPLNNISDIFTNRNRSPEDANGFKKPLLPKTAPSAAPIPPVTASNHDQSLPGDEVKKKKSLIINGNYYEKSELLGRGGSSKVYKVKALSTNKPYAIKKVTFDQFDDSCVQGFKGEIDLLLKLKDSSRVVKLIDYAIGEGSIYLIMECGDIDLAHVLQNKLSISNELDINFVKYHSIEMLRCVHEVHQAGIVHSDLKPANFLFIKGVLKIIDFGIANAVPDHTANIYRESQIGTPNYMAPEALVEVSQAFPGMPVPESRQASGSHKNTWKVGKPSDVWSCGCIIYQMIYGKPPYGGYSGNQRVMAIMNPQVKIQFPTRGLGNVKVPQSAIELMQNCLKRNPNERWSIAECLDSDFLNPKVISEAFVRDLVHSAVNFGHNNRVNGNGLITADVYDKLVDTVLKQIDELNYG